jgi:hypothetical protein
MKYIYSILSLTLIFAFLIVKLDNNFYELICLILYTFCLILLTFWLIIFDDFKNDKFKNE